MFDAVIFADAAEPAARTLACLVEGAVEGLLNHVLLVSGGVSAELASLADAAGCRIAQGVGAGTIRDALERHLVTPHALAFAGGALLQPGWPGRLGDELRRRSEPKRETILAFRPERRIEAWTLVAAIRIQRRVPLAHGALVPRPLLFHGFEGGSVKSRGPIRLLEMTAARLQITRA